MLPADADVIGREAYWGMSMYFDPNTNYSSTYYVGPNWHAGNPCGGQSFTGLALNNDRMSFTVRGSNTPGQCSPWYQRDFYFNDPENGGAITSFGKVGSGTYADAQTAAAWKPVTKGIWYDFVFRFVWRDDFNGTVEGWMKRRSSNTYTEVIPLTHTPTLYSATVNGQIVSSRIGPYFGIYRPRNVANDMTVWMDEIRRGATFASVTVPDTSTAGTSVPSNSTPPSIDGTAQSGSTLTASTGTWANSPTGYAYRWQRCGSTGGSCSDIGGATQQTYVLDPADTGSSLRVSVTATNSAGSASAISAATALVQAAPVPAPDPEAIGGRTLGPTTIGASRAPGGTGFVAVSGPGALAVSAPPIKLTGYLEGGGAAEPMRAVIYKEGNGNAPGEFAAVSDQVTIAAGAPAAWVDFPFSSAAPLAPGNYWLGYWFGGSNVKVYYDSVHAAGRYVAAAYSSNGDPPTSFSDSDFSLYATLGASVPSSTALPTISGTATNGQTLTAANGAWSDSPTGYAYQWQRCDSGAANCSAIGGATSRTYALVSDDVGRTLRVVVTATNSGGSTPATSASTAVVQAAPDGTTLGKTTIGPFTHRLGGDFVEASGRYMLASARSVTKLTAYLQGGESATAMRAVVYSDSGNKPGTFVAVSQPVTIAAGQAAGWVDFPISSSPTLPAGQYWLGLWASNFNVLGYYDTISAGGYYAPALYSPAGSPPSGWPGGGSGDTLSYSLYATLGAADASAPPIVTTTTTPPPPPLNPRTRVRRHRQA